MAALNSGEIAVNDRRHVNQRAFTQDRRDTIDGKHRQVPGGSSQSLLRLTALRSWSGHTGYALSGRWSNEG